MRVEVITKPISNKGRKKTSKYVKEFIALKKGGKDCLLFDSHHAMRSAYHAIYAHCQREDVTYRPYSSPVENGFAIWKT